MDRPSWNADLRELTFRGRRIKRFRQLAGNQVPILAAFEEEGWPRRIYDPLPASRVIPARKRLHDTIRGLNARHVSRGVIRFQGDGTGEGIAWTLVGDSQSPDDDAPAVHSSQYSACFGSASIRSRRS